MHLNLELMIIHEKIYQFKVPKMNWLRWSVISWILLYIYHCFVAIVGIFCNDALVTKITIETMSDLL